MALEALEPTPITTNRGVKVRVQINDSDTIMSINTSDSYPSGISTRWRNNEGFKKVFLTSGDYNIDMDFGSAYSGKSVKIRRARLKIRRID